MRKVFIQLIVLMTFAVHLSSPSFAASNDPFMKEPVRGIYVKASNTKGPRFNQLLTLVQKTDLNAMVIDIKDDNGNLTFLPSKNSPYYSIGKPYIAEPRKLIETLQNNHIYPIARIVVFKDTVKAAKNPDWSFKTSKGVWKNARGDSFTNPFLKEVWDYNIGMAIEAANLGFKEIQFDYVRFPEKFETFEKNLNYQRKSIGQLSPNNERIRVAAVSRFVHYAHQKLIPYHVKMSVDTFGNATVIPEARGIGQNFSEIAQNVDVISAMIYPSHWNGIFGIKKPDLQPYQLVKQYTKVEKSRLTQLPNPPVSRPWLQDFTATWLGAGNFKTYGKKEIEDQVSALHSEGIDGFLLWSGTNTYTANVDYSPY
ncbi:putative glycoside hydrolase [Neobacillus sp. PS3-34]|uniref:putative glycoside hydrolase n=1 Tax=Neobacillus sp. PS3-34 TaxID=3070678 RepID=UPI0027E05E3B|nr:putative glycoside hydrolase [Neobacillus sp. PS3-34]WML48739.1 putative glycoside hydrolase [Neobacillus sp. PS3-34]